MKRKHFFFRLAVFINLLVLLLLLVAMNQLLFKLEFPLLTLGTPVLCFISLFFFFFWLVRFQWPLFFFLIAFALSFESWQLLYQFKSNAITTSQGIKIMSFNVRSFNRFEWLKEKEVPQSIADFIEKNAPDVICFQEYDVKQAPKFNKYPYQIFIPYKEKGQIGSCIVSKFPLLHPESIPFEGSSNGGMQSDLLWKKDTLRLYNIHFESLRINSKDTLFSTQYSKKFASKIATVFKQQKKQINQFNMLAKESPHPEIICTDLNNNAFSESYQSVAKGRFDAFIEQGKGFGGTYRFPYFPLRIDYILTDSKLKIIDFETHELQLSDHRPISAIISL